MSYLDAPRFHFRGTFFANPPTINNSTENFAPEATFNNRPPSASNPNSEWWNPDGAAFFKFPRIRVTAAAGLHGHYDPDDPLVGASIVSIPYKGQGPSIYGRLNDLDPDQQGRTLMTGLVIQLTLAGGGSPALTGNVRPMNIIDLWTRMTGFDPHDPSNIRSPGCMFLTIVENLQWGDVSDSKVLAELWTASPDALSFKINVDAFTGRPQCEGRVVGTIGPHRNGEPVHVLPKRKLSTVSTLVPPANASAMGPALFEIDGEKLVIDLGNSVPTSTPDGGPFHDLGPVELAVGIDPVKPLAVVPIYSDVKAYTKQFDTYAGIFRIPLDAAVRSVIENNPAAIRIALKVPANAFTANQAQSQKKGVPDVGRPSVLPPVIEVVLAEDPTGRYVAAEFNALRLEHGAPSWNDTPQADDASKITSDAHVPIYCTRFGKPDSVVIDIQNVPQIFQWPNPVTGGTWYIDNIPRNFVTVDGSTVEKGGMESPTTPIPVGTVSIIDGKGILTINCTKYGLADLDPRRLGLDRQVYYFDWTYSQDPPGLSVLLFHSDPPVENPTWTGEIANILSQYDALYPYMASKIDLASYDDVTKNAGLIQMMLQLDMSDPAYMPVTRDLSLRRRLMILRWYKNGAPLS